MAKVANFEVTFELQGLKIHVKGDREIAPVIANNVGKHFGQVFSPASLIEAPKNGNEPQPKVIEAEVPTSRSRKKKGSKSTATTSSESPVSWTHDESRWGLPSQGWNPTQKSAWLLYVVGEAAGKRDLSPTEIAEIFRAHFRDAGPPRPSNISRDLGKETNLFGEDNGRYFLKQDGKDEAVKLVAEAKSGARAA